MARTKRNKWHRIATKAAASDRCTAILESSEGPVLTCFICLEEGVLRDPTATSTGAGNNTTTTAAATDDRTAVGTTNTATTVDCGGGDEYSAGGGDEYSAGVSDANGCCGNGGPPELVVVAAAEVNNEDGSQVQSQADDNDVTVARGGVAVQQLRHCRRYRVKRTSSVHGVRTGATEWHNERSAANECGADCSNSSNNNSSCSSNSTDNSCDSADENNCASIAHVVSIVAPQHDMSPKHHGGAPHRRRRRQHTLRDDDSSGTEPCDGRNALMAVQSSPCVVIHVQQQAADLAQPLLLVSDPQHGPADNNQHRNNGTGGKGHSSSGLPVEASEVRVAKGGAVELQCYSEVPRCPLTADTGVAWQQLSSKVQPPSSKQRQSMQQCNVTTDSGSGATRVTAGIRQQASTPSATAANSGSVLVPCCTQCFAVVHRHCWAEWRECQKFASLRAQLLSYNRPSPAYCCICKTGYARIENDEMCPFAGVTRGQRRLQDELFTVIRRMLTQDSDAHGEEEPPLCTPISAAVAMLFMLLVGLADLYVIIVPRVYPGHVLLVTLLICHIVAVGYFVVLAMLQRTEALGMLRIRPDEEDDGSDEDALAAEECVVGAHIAAVFVAASAGYFQRGAPPANVMDGHPISCAAVEPHAPQDASSSHTSGSSGRAIAQDVSGGRGGAMGYAEGVFGGGGLAEVLVLAT